MSASTDSDDEVELVKTFVLRNFSAPSIDSDYFTINGWEDFEILEDEIEVKLVKRDESGSWFDVRVRCEGDITRDEDDDGREDPPKLPRSYFLTGKVLIPVYEDADEADEAVDEAQTEWYERFPDKISYEDLQGTGSYRRASSASRRHTPISTSTQRDPGEHTANEERE